MWTRAAEGRIDATFFCAPNEHANMQNLAEPERQTFLHEAFRRGRLLRC